MIKKAILGAFLLALSLVANASSDSTSAARDASTEWLALVDDLKYEESWLEASSILRTAVSQSEWEQHLGSMRGSLGTIASREPDKSEFYETLEELPDGEYYLFTFKSAFENKKFTYEVVGVAKESDSSWRVMGYYFE